MKIAQVCHRYYPNRGGVENHVKEISERLAKKFHVEVITADLSSNNKQITELKGVRIKRFRSIAPNNAYFFSPQILFYLRKRDFDVIHAHNYHAFPALFASLVKGGKFVFTPHYHGMGSTAFRDFLNRPYKLIGSKIFKRADKIICVSEFEKELIIRNFGILEDKMVVIPNGVALKEIKETQPFDFDADLILYVGRLEKYKNIHLAIRTMEFLPESYFYIIGETGNYKNELGNLIHKLNLENRVKILSNVSDAEKYRWMKTCSLFVNLSSIEAFGITVLEALAAGKPVIVNEEGGLRELADKFDGVFPVRVHEFKERDSIEKLAKIMRESMGKEVKTDLDEYDWDIIAKKVEEVYSEVYKR
ncbi:MAG TPA: glycosyltransferase family 4 protein [Thermoplasmata archaeon]|nr:glycosyltransferase family 4 protein [Thermoplasmata archaeon]